MVMERELDNIETSFTLFHDVGVGQLCYVFFINSRQPITKTKLEDSMGVLVNRHPLLHMCAKKTNGKWRWVEIDGLQMDIRVETSHDWQSTFSNALCGGFDVENGPLWSVTLMPNAVSDFYDHTFDNHAALVFRFSHSIIDGLGVINLMNDLQDLLSGDENKLQQLASQLEMPKPIVEVAYQHSNRVEKWLLRVNFWTWVIECFVRPILNRFVPAVIQKTTTFEKYVKDSSKCASMTDARTKVCYITIGQEELVKIYSECKLRGTTIHSACQAAGDIALCEMITETAERKGIAATSLGTDTISVTPSHKKRIPESSPESSNYVVSSAYLIEQNIRISEWNQVSRFWECAHRVQIHNHGNLLTAIKQACFSHKLVNYCLSDSSQFIRYFNPEKRFYLNGYTNHGNCNFLNRDSNAGIKVGGLVAGVGLHYYGGIVYHFITTLDNKMIWNVIYPTNFTDGEFVTRYLNRCVDILKERCNAH